MNHSSVFNTSCSNTTYVVGNGGKLKISIMMFLAGVVGNLLALFILVMHQKKRRSRSSIFCILVTGLALTDLLGTCLLSPPVFICYARNLSLIALGGERLCNLFGFVVSFFGLAPTLILCTMALDRCFAISHPYFYSVHIRQSFAKFTLIFIYLFSLAFCLLPYSGFGKFRQYCPGTWCFIDMDATGDAQANLVQAFSLSYSSLMALLIFIVFICNGSVIVSLCKMHLSQIVRRGSVVSVGRKKRLSLAWFGQGEEEIDHLVLLALMTIIFVVFSLPLIIAGFINAIHPYRGDDENLIAFRFYSLNPIVDPWIFILFRKSVFRHLGSLLNCRFGKQAIAGFINAIHPYRGDDENLIAFRFYSLNPIVDPWIFILFRKSVFRHLGSLLNCRFGKQAVKTTAHCALSLPLDSVLPHNRQL